MLIGQSTLSLRDMQWNEKKLTGGANWQPQVAPTSWGGPGSQMVSMVLDVEEVLCVCTKLMKTNHSHGLCSPVPPAGCLPWGSRCHAPSHGSTNGSAARIRHGRDVISVLCAASVPGEGLAHHTSVSPPTAPNYRRPYDASDVRSANDEATVSWCRSPWGPGTDRHTVTDIQTH